MDLRGYEFYKVSGAPVSGALAEVWDAVDGTPGGAPITNTTTTANGQWEFLGLTASLKDVRVTFTGSIRWYKGLGAAALNKLMVATSLILTGATVTGGTFASSTLTAPTIADFTNATHAHDSAAHGGTVAHTSLSSIGSNSHATIDTHIAASTAHGISGVVVGTTDGQTLSNKTLSSPTLSGTVSGTPTWASAQAFPAVTTVGADHVIRTNNGTKDLVQVGTVSSGSIGNGTISVAVTFARAFTSTPDVTISIADMSGALTQTHLIAVSRSAITTTGFSADFNNQTGGTQTITAAWVATGGA